MKINEIIGTRFLPWVSVVEGNKYTSRTVYNIPDEYIKSLYIELKEECLSLDDFYLWISKPLSFPDYFGKNITALEECLTDGDVVSLTSLYIIIRNGRSFLNFESIPTVETFLETMSSVGLTWLEGGQWPWKLPPRDFRFIVVLD